MLRVAFYAPLKPPDHPNPSGDRQIARLFMQALQQAGCQVELASHLRSRDGKGDLLRQQRLEQVAKGLARRLIRRFLQRPAAQRPQLWFTYHHYHKAPDWIGPQVADALNIPYVIAEASYSARQHNGPWQHGLQGSIRGLRRADALLCLNPKDQPALRQLLGEQAPLHQFPPFLDLSPYLRLDTAAPARQRARQQLGEQWQIPADRPWLITAAMMRPGDKQASYHLLAEALRQLPDRPWQLLVLGDGLARTDIENDFRGLPVSWLGRQPPEALQPWLSAADLFVWPAVNEAFGMALLEAQACGLPVIAGDEGGVASILAPQASQAVTPRDSQTFARAVAAALDTDLHQRGMQARQHVLEHHGLPSASQQLRQLLSALVDKYASQAQAEGTE
ncbi:hypothetical protein WH50_06070 [Pokkaliibacter plantistimulans]|uniref:Glycosyl transferase family 1 domain-containing protein n=1 Tax=Pokkaliibacter plantistimulans TaxID=1635171 RepID=A0ABX5M3M1_9GAMM|nr:glycosyltransferase family 4 protein [Pokkaliibacter plantistimulans]PXF32158.1 hypothetical protein WH50_06070 [Pokkaliibacter plantistimulans]